MQVRPARSSDREFIVRLAYRFAEFELPAWLDRRSVTEGTARQLERALMQSDDRSTVFVAESGGSPVGFAWVHLVSDFYGGGDLAKISEIAVERDGTGAGSALMAACEAWAAQRGCERLVLNVMDGNHGARGFYEHHGFQPEYTMLVKALTGCGKAPGSG